MHRPLAPFNIGVQLVNELGEVVGTQDPDLVAPYFLTKTEVLQREEERRKKERRGPRTANEGRMGVRLSVLSQ